MITSAEGEEFHLRVVPERCVENSNGSGISKITDSEKKEYNYEDN